MNEQQTERYLNKIMGATMNIDEVLNTLMQVRHEKDQAAVILKSINKRINDLEYEVEKYFESNGLDSVEHGGYKFSSKLDVYAKIVDKDALYDYLKEQDQFENLVTLSATVAKKYWNDQKDLHVDGEFAIPGMEPTSARKKLSIRKV